MRQAAAMNYGMTDVGMVVVAPAASFHHTHHHHHHHEAAAAAAAAAAASGDPIFPLLSGGPCVLDPDAAAKSGSGAHASAIQFWQPPPQSPSSAAAAGANPNPSASPFAYLKKPLPMLDAGAGSSASGATTCQDCGNQAKKDCGHNRCRTCCKSRGFDCSTHVKSTWVPAARRRERQQLAASGSASSSPATASAAAAAASASKKPRLLSSQTTTSHTSTSNATTPRSFDTTSSHQDASFRDSLPRQVRAPAVFKCVRVTSIEDGEDEYAYQGTVTINGHLFKGFLYDQGPDDGRHAATSNDDSTAGVLNISELHLGAMSASGAGGVREGGTSMAPTELYGAGGHHPHFLGGSSSYGNTMN